MEKFIVIFVLCATSVYFVFGAENRTCDYNFGDQTWNYSKVFFDKDISFPAGAKTQTVELPGQKGQMVSHVCITLPDGMDKDTVTASYDPLDREVSVALARQAAKEFIYHVTAKRHGY